MQNAIRAPLVHRMSRFAIGLTVLACSSPTPAKAPPATAPAAQTIGSRPTDARRPFNASTTAPSAPSSTAPTASEAVASAEPQQPALRPTSEALVPLFGKSVPTAFIASAPGGHWGVVCEASEEGNGDGKLAIRLTQHGEFEGAPLRHALYVNGKRLGIDEFAGSDPTGRYVAFVTGNELKLLDTSTDQTATLVEADTRATQASFRRLRSVTFSDDGRRLAYLRGKTTSILVVRDLSRQTEQTLALAGSPTYRLEFTPGSRYVQLEAPVRDTNKNGRLDWLTPLRKGPAPCPSPIPTYNVWQFPGDEPDVTLFDVETGRLSVPEGYALAAGSFVVRRTEDLRLIADNPGKQTLPVSSKECNGRVLHVDAATGAILFGCSSAWGQRRQMFLRTQEARVELGFDLAAYELDTALPTREPIVALYPGNQSLLFNVRTRERWPLLDGTQVVSVSGNTALIEQNLQLTVITLNPDASFTARTGPIKRTPFSGVLRQGAIVSVGPHVFDLAKRSYLGRYAADGSPLALSRGGDGLFPVKAATPTELGSGPLVWHAPSKSSQPARK
jgi:hypothetical protein